MPDHFHALVEGLKEDADFRKFVSMFKQRCEHRHRQEHQGPLWQDGYYDRILRSDKALVDVAAYIVANPRRKGMPEAACGCPFVGSDRYSLPELLASIQTRP